MLTQLDIQKILDHYHVGKIIEFIDYDLYLAVRTHQGMFYILTDDPSKVRMTEAVRKEMLVRAVGSVDRMLLADYSGRLSEDASYVHYQHKYYSVYKKAV